MKKGNTIFILIIMFCIFLTSIGTSYAAILFDSVNVNYSNSTSGISSTNVKSAIDELYGKATTYTTLKNRTTTLETTFNNLGTITDKSASKNVATATNTAITTLTLSAGTYLLMGFVDFQQNAENGRREMKMYTGSCSGTSIGVVAERAQASTESYDRMDSVTRIKPTSSTTYYLCAYQNSGSSITVSGYLGAVRIK